MVEVNIYPRYKEMEYLLNLYPPQRANKFLPEWYKKQKLYNRDEFYSEDKHPAAKKCPAIVEELTRGIIIPSWSDIYIVKKGEEVMWQVEVAKQEALAKYPFIDYQNFEQTKHMNLNEIVGYGVLKLSSPYLFKTPPGYGLHFKDAFYHHRKNIRLLSGYVETDIWHETNFPFEFYDNIYSVENFTLTIKAGDPLLVIDTYKKDDTTDLKINNFSEEMSEQHLTNSTKLFAMSEDWKRYSKFFK